MPPIRFSFSRSLSLSPACARVHTHTFCSPSLLPCLASLPYSPSHVAPHLLSGLRMSSFSPVQLSSKRESQLVECRFRPHYASCPARQSCVTGRASTNASPQISTQSRKARAGADPHSMLASPTSASDLFPPPGRSGLSSLCLASLYKAPTFCKAPRYLPDASRLLSLAPAPLTNASKPDSDLCLIQDQRRCAPLSPQLCFDDLFAN
eukprot:6210539-Pleurochrysis_carterae.AAC.1